MRKHGSKILIGVVCLILLVFMYGCKFSLLKQAEPEYKTVQFAYSVNEFYPIEIPGFMPDFTKFDSKLIMFNSLLILLNYIVPESEIEDHYRLFINTDQNDIPGIIALSSYIGEESRFWIYDQEGLPQELNMNQFMVWLQKWMNTQASKMYEEEEKPVESI